MRGANDSLRWGYTTGSCAAGAAKAAAAMLVTGKRLDHICLMTPKGYELVLEIEDISMEKDRVSCAVRKDSGDDPDVTNGSLVYACIRRVKENGIRITGGTGIGIVTRPGLDQSVGNYAINSTPRRMIREAVEEATAQDTFSGGYEVSLSIPDGVYLAEKTFNPRLGIVGGISILGTTGIVEPMSDEALKATIEVEIKVKEAEKWEILPMAPGNYGKAFMQKAYGFSLDTAVTTSNFIADSMEMAADHGFQKVLFVGHAGKMVKVAGGIPNTHSRYGDHRMEIFYDMAASFLSDENKAAIEKALRESVSSDDAASILERFGIREMVMKEMVRRIQENLQRFSKDRIQAEVVIFSNVYGELGCSSRARSWIMLLADEQNHPEKK